MKHKAKILIAEDDPNFGMVLQSYLSVNQYEVSLHADGELALQAFLREDPDLCILDVMMPHRDGFSLAEAMGKTGREVPYVFLTARALKEDQVKGYKLGAIDYLIKPFDPEILLLKLEAILSRTQPSNSGSDGEIQIGNFYFDPDQRALTLDGDSQRLSPKESQLLHLLCKREGEVLTREEALVKIWEEDNYFTAQSMNVYLTKLRKHLRRDNSHHIEIENVHGKGFILKVLTIHP